MTYHGIIFSSSMCFWTWYFTSGKISLLKYVKGTVTDLNVTMWCPDGWIQRSNPKEKHEVFLRKKWRTGISRRAPFLWRNFLKECIKLKTKGDIMCWHTQVNSYILPFCVLLTEGADGFPRYLLSSIPLLV